MVGGQHVADMSIYNSSPDEMTLQASNTIIAECTGGEEVYMRAISSAYNQLYGEESARRTTFSGCLLTVL